MFAHMKTTLTAVATIVTFASLWNPSQANAQHWTPSGMLLGIYAVQDPYQNGLRITGMIPGYPSNGVLLPGDVLYRAATDFQVYSIRTHQQLEQAKSQVGVHQPTAIEFFRPGIGMQYAWVTFVPTAQIGIAHANDHAAAADWRAEGAHGSAQERFQRLDANGPNGSIGHQQQRPSQNSSNNPASLFNR